MELKSIHVRHSKWSFVDDFTSTARKYPENIAFIRSDNDQRVTFRGLDEFSNQIAHWLISKNCSKDVIAILIPSSVQYIATWLGISKTGGSAALINTNLFELPLIHAINTGLKNSTSKTIICCASLAESILNPKVFSSLEKGTKIIFLFSDEPINETASNLIRQHSFDQISKQYLNQNYPSGPVDPLYRKDVTWSSPLFYIYTSGTTGLPKASIFNHLRLWGSGNVFRVLCQITQRDSIYCALPVYHTAANMGIAAMMITGCTLVLRPKFSVRAFSDDVSKYRCTIMQYIGELARYLSHSPKNPLDDNVQLRVAFGNGLRPEIWTKFQQRYHIQQIVEFYGSSEGNVNLFNNTGKVGAIGIIPWWIRWIYPVILVKYDIENDQLIRDKNGRCILCDPEEPGQILGLIKENNPSRRFDGYTDPEATSKKVVRGVFKEGDMYFCSGDLLKKDSFGFFYWVDRIGDTFRWKGENVSTAEVAQVLSDFQGFDEINVYGVELPGSDGRAGMAAVTFLANHSTNNFDWQGLFAFVTKNLPAYARPLFIRVSSEMEITSTFKHRKNELRNDGIDPNKTKGATVYYLDQKNKTYSELTNDIYNKIMNREIIF